MTDKVKEQLELNIECVYVPSANMMHLFQPLRALYQYIVEININKNGDV